MISAWKRSRTGFGHTGCGKGCGPNPDDGYEYPNILVSKWLAAPQTKVCRAAPCVSAACESRRPTAVRRSICSAIRLANKIWKAEPWGLSQTSGVDGLLGMAANLIAPNRSNPHDPEC